MAIGTFTNGAIETELESLNIEDAIATTIAGAVSTRGAEDGEGDLGVFEAVGSLVRQLGHQVGALVPELLAHAAVDFDDVAELRAVRARAAV
jgi:hypothetical protein